MIVVDSSVWIENLRGGSSRSARRLRAASIDDEFVVGDLILLEVLQGARDDLHAARIERELREWRMVSMLDASLAVRAARNYRLLRARGVTIRSTADLIIGTFCIDHGYALLHQDRDFDAMAAHLGLRIA